MVSGLRQGGCQRAEKLFALREWQAASARETTAPARKCSGVVNDKGVEMDRTAFVTGSKKMSDLMPVFQTAYPT